MRIPGPFLAAAAMACAPAPVPDDLQVIAVIPSDGSAAVPLDISPQLVFTKPLPRGVGLDATLATRDSQWLLPCPPTASDPAILSCELPRALAADTRYTLTVDLGPDGRPDAVSDFSTALPRGLAYDIGPDLRVLQAGGSDRAASLLEEALTGGGTMLLALDGLYPGKVELPWDGWWLLGSGEVRPSSSGLDHALVDDDQGFTLAARGTLMADGGFQAGADHASLPVTVDGDSTSLLLDDVRIDGHIPLDSGWQELDPVTIDALMPQSSLARLEDQAPGWAVLVAELANLVDLDVDTDGDGVPDAATLRLGSSGTRVELTERR